MAADTKKTGNGGGVTLHYSRQTITMVVTALLAGLGLTGAGGFTVGSWGTSDETIRRVVQEQADMMTQEEAEAFYVERRERDDVNRRLETLESSVGKMSERLVELIHVVDDLNHSVEGMQ